MQIGHRKIGPNEKPLVIAEIGINHGGDLAVAKHMVELAARSGCECIKHQTHFVEDEMTEAAKQIFPPNADMSIWDVMASCALSKDDEIALKAYTEDLGLIYLSTPFSRAASDFLEEIGVPGFKIGSGEADNLPLIRHIAKKGKPVILSTGMQTIETIRQSVQILEDSGVDYALLECTNLYPSPPEIVSLRGVSDLKAAFPQCHYWLFRSLHWPRNGFGLSGFGRLNFGTPLHGQPLPERARYRLFDGPFRIAPPDRSVAGNPHRAAQSQTTHRTGGRCLSLRPSQHCCRQRFAQGPPHHGARYLGPSSRKWRNPWL